MEWNQRQHKFFLFFALSLVLTVRCLYAIARLIAPSADFETVPVYAQPYLWQVIAVVFAIATTLRFAYLLRNARWNARNVSPDDKVAVWSQLWFASLVMFFTEGTSTTATIALLAMFPVLGSHFSAPNAAIAVTSIISMIVVLLVDLNNFYDLRVIVFQDEEVPLLHRFATFGLTLVVAWMCTLRFEALILVEQRRFNSVTDFVVDLLDQVAVFDTDGLGEHLSANAGKEFITHELDFVARTCLKNLAHVRPYLPSTLIPGSEQKELDPDDLALVHDVGDEDDGDLGDYVGRSKSYAAADDETSSLATVLRSRTCTILAIECAVQLKAPTQEMMTRSHQFLSVALEQISRNDGVVNTMSPFAVVASFNGQSPCLRHAKRASSAALGILNKLKSNDPPLEVYMAVDTRENLVGICGADRQLARVVSGDGVVLAQRLVNLARYLRTPIVISGEAAMEVSAQFFTIPIDVVRPGWKFNAPGSASVSDVTVFELRSRKNETTLDLYGMAFQEFKAGRIAAAMGHLNLYFALRPDVADQEFHARRLDSVCRAFAGDQTIRPAVFRQDLGWEHFRGEEELLLNAPQSALRRPLEEHDTALDNPREPEEQNFRETLAELQPTPEAKGEEKTDGLIDMFVFSNPSDDEGDSPAPVANAGGNEPEVDTEALPSTFDDDVHMEKWLLSQQSLGSGSFSAVKLGMSVEGLLVAMKIFSLRAKQTNPRLLAEEVARMRRLSHHNIVSYISCALLKSSGHFIIVMEYVSGGSLKHIIDTFGPPPLTAIRKYITDLLRGLKYLHENGIIHCDVKPHNALLTSDGSCKLSDFGSAVNITTYKGEEAAGGEEVMVRGTSYYLAPEACRNEITSAVDIWSVGITVLELMTGRLPWEFKGGGEAAFIRELGKNPNFMPVIPSDVSANAANFCKRCLTRNPEQRPTADELLRSPFLSG